MARVFDIDDIYFMASHGDLLSRRRPSQTFDVQMHGEPCCLADAVIVK